MLGDIERVFGRRKIRILGTTRQDHARQLEALRGEHARRLPRGLLTSSTRRSASTGRCRGSTVMDRVARHNLFTIVQSSGDEISRPTKSARHAPVDESARLAIFRRRVQEDLGDGISLSIQSSSRTSSCSRS